MRVLQVSAELFPLLKTGGLADVAAALPPALIAAGAEVRLLLPGFEAFLADLQNPVDIAHWVTPWGEEVQMRHGHLRSLSGPHGPVAAYVLVAPGLYQRPGGPYEDERRQPFADNHRRFAALGWAAAHLAHGLDPWWRPQVVHSHDWHAGLAPACLAAWQGPHVPSVFTVHNLAYQGVFAAHHFAELGLPAHMFSMNGLEFHGQLSFMKAGLYHADRLTTVSPSYAREIQTPEQGCGLDGLLRQRQAVLSGILNGVDPAVWNPASDPLIAHPYTARDLSGKAVCKRHLQQHTGLHIEPQAPLFAIVSRLTEQKGLHLVQAVASDIVRRGGQLLVLGSGEPGLEQGFQALAQQHPGQVAVHIGYHEALSHAIFAGSDFTLVPSRFEPCGLTQLYGLAYGSTPVVRRVGGLADTVTDTDLLSLDEDRATGLVFDAFTIEGLRQAVQRAFALHARPADGLAVRTRGMQQGHDWHAPAQAYLQLYRQLVAETHS